MMFFDPLYIVFSLPALLLAFWAQWKMQSAFKKFSQMPAFAGLTGAQVARRMLDFNGLSSVQVEQVEGALSDHYDPRGKVLRLSRDIYYGASLSAAGVAAHEAGHAIQDNQNYSPLRVRTAMVPTVQIGSWLGPLVFVAGIFMTPMVGTSLAWLGLVFFATVAAFAIVTLPVEYDASRRAREALVTQGIVSYAELGGVKSVLDAAALTYVAAAGQVVSTLLYYLFFLTGFSQPEE